MRASMLIVLPVALLLAAVAVLFRDPAERLPEVAATGTVAADERQLNLFALGDWGSDRGAQADVADAMADHAHYAGRPDAVLLVGDNFYGRLEAVDDAEWDRLFERMYDRSALPVPFHAVLGNHDYQHGKDAVQLAYAGHRPGTRWSMPARWYRLDLPADRPIATVLMLDSNYNELTADEWRVQLQWLTAEVARPRSTRWLVVCTHHPLFSNGPHGDDPRLQREWGPLLRSGGTDFYLAGHDHMLEHLEIPGNDTTFLVCGGGGAETYAIKRTDRGTFTGRSYGFLHLRLGDRSADVRFLDARRRVVHAFSRTPNVAAATRPG